MSHRATIASSASSASSALIALIASSAYQALGKKSRLSSVIGFCYLQNTYLFYL